jgi:hypothetical protein
LLPKKEQGGQAWAKRMKTRDSYVSNAADPCCR